MDNKKKWYRWGAPAKHGKYKPVSGPDMTMTAKEASRLGVEAREDMYEPGELNRRAVQAKRELLEAAYRAVKKGDV